MSIVKLTEKNYLCTTHEPSTFKKMPPASKEKAQSVMGVNPPKEKQISVQPEARGLVLQVQAP